MNEQIPSPVELDRLHEEALELNKKPQEKILREGETHPETEKPEKFPNNMEVLTKRWREDIATEISQKLLEELSQISESSASESAIDRPSGGLKAVEDWVKMTPTYQQFLQRMREGREEAIMLYPIGQAVVKISESFRQIRRILKEKNEILPETDSAYHSSDHIHKMVESVLREAPPKSRTDPRKDQEAAEEEKALRWTLLEALKGPRNKLEREIEVGTPNNPKRQRFFIVSAKGKEWGITIKPGPEVIYVGYSGRSSEAPPLKWVNELAKKILELENIPLEYSPEVAAIIRDQKMRREREASIRSAGAGIDARFSKD